jgi:hypothetical protein
MKIQKHQDEIDSLITLRNKNGHRCCKTCYQFARDQFSPDSPICQQPGCIDFAEWTPYPPKSVTEEIKEKQHSLDK